MNSTERVFEEKIIVKMLSQANRVSEKDLNGAPASQNQVRLSDKITNTFSSRIMNNNFLSSRFMENTIS